MSDGVLGERVRWGHKTGRGRGTGGAHDINVGSWVAFGVGEGSRSGHPLLNKVSHNKNLTSWSVYPRSWVGLA